MTRRTILAFTLLGISFGLLWYVYSGRGGSATATSEPGETDYYAQREWNTEYNSKLNIPLFVFRDHNRNGRYDLGDKPQAAVAVRLLRPDGEERVRRSNINGFTNFTMSQHDEGAEVNRVGEQYVFEVQVPPGFRLTTDNLRQETRFVALPGSVAGLVAERPPAVVGLAPELRVSGRLVAGGVDTSPEQMAGFAVNSLDPRGLRTRLAVDTRGYFSFAATPGPWRVEVADQAGATVLTRSFQVGNAPVRLSALALGQQELDPLAVPVTQDFEYLQRSTIDKIPGGQSGLVWDYLLAVDNQLYRGPGYVNVLMSGKMVGYNSSGHPATISPVSAGERFDFVGAYFAAAWPRSDGETLLVKAWREGELVAREQLSLSHQAPVWFEADYRQIDRLELSTMHYWQFVTDDMRFRLAVRPFQTDGNPAAHLKYSGACQGQSRTLRRNVR